MGAEEEIILYWNEEDQLYIAEVPELRVVSRWKTYFEAQQDPEKAIVEWIETAQILNRPVPEPKGRLTFA